MNKHAEDRNIQMSSSPLPTLNANDIPSDPVDLLKYGDRFYREYDTSEPNPTRSSNLPMTQATEESYHAAKTTDRQALSCEEHVTKSDNNNGSNDDGRNEKGELEPIVGQYRGEGYAEDHKFDIATESQQKTLAKSQSEMPSREFRGHLSTQGWHVVNNRNEHQGPQPSVSRFHEKSRTRIEGNEIDNKYFDHGYFLQYHGLTIQGSLRGHKYEDIGMQQSDPDPGPELYSIKPISSGTSAHERMNNSIMSRPLKRADKSNMENIKPEVEERLAKRTWKQISETVEEAFQEKNRKRPTTLVSFHKDEDSWILLFFEKIKAVIQGDRHIQIPNDHIIYRMFNTYFDGRILKGPGGDPLPPRITRLNGTLYNHIRRNASDRLTELREEIMKSLENSTGGQLYIPVITDQEIHQYISVGLVNTDDPNDPTMNMGLSLPDREMKQNESLRKTYNKRRKQLAQEGDDSSAQDQSASEAGRSFGKLA